MGDSGSTTTTRFSGKRRRVEDDEEDLIDFPGIPSHVAQIGLSGVSPLTLYSVCRSWRRLIYSPYFPPFSSIYALFLPILKTDLPTPLHFFSFDPISVKWVKVPSPPEDLPTGFLFHHPSFISRRLPIQSVSVSGKLVLIAATNLHFSPALTHPLIFDPSLKKWTKGPPLSAPRRWCAAGSVGGSVYVSSGIGSQYNTDVARSVEKWSVLDSHKWSKMGKLKDGKFSRDAIDAVGWRGKLCMVNVKGDAAKEGVIYDVETDSWGVMPEGMLAGWRGPAAAMEEQTIYVVEESKGLLKKYEHVSDAWVEVLENEILKGAQQIVAGGGKVCVVCGDGVNIAVVDVAARRVFVVECPPEMQAVSIHILPRMSR